MKGIVFECIVPGRSLKVFQVNIIMSIIFFHTVSGWNGLKALKGLIAYGQNRLR